MFRQNQFKMALAAVTAILSLMAFGQSLRAESPRALQVRGKVESVHDDFDLLGGTIQERDGFVLYVAYDRDAKLVDRSGATATYSHSGASPAGMKIFVADRVFVANRQQPLELIVRDGNRRDSFVAKGILEIPRDLQMVKWHKNTMTLTMIDDSGAVLGDTSLPAFTSLSDWRATIRISFVRSARFTSMKFFPAASVVVSGTVEDVRMVENLDVLVQEGSGENENRRSP